MSIADTLRAGKANIIEYGWAQGDGACIGPENGCCVVTSMPSRPSDSKDGAVVLFKRANDIAKTESVGAWNDDPARTKEEVLAAFDKAITLAEQEQA